MSLKYVYKMSECSRKMGGVELLKQALSRQ